MTERLLGTYRREPAELPHHTVTVEKNDDGDLQWKPEGDESGWVLKLSTDDDTLLLLSEDCPHYEECKQVTVELEEDKVIGLRFNGDLYAKKDFIFEIPDTVKTEDEDDGSGGGAGDDSDCAVLPDSEDDLSTDG